MKKKPKKLKKAQSITEYGVVIACIVASLIAMQAYFRRGLSGQIKSSVDQRLGSQFDPDEGSYTTVSARSGESIEVSLTEWGDSIYDSEGEMIVPEGWREMTYSVTGPEGVTDAGGNLIIPPDAGRAAMQITEYKESSVELNNLGE